MRLKSESFRRHNGRKHKAILAHISTCVSLKHSYAKLSLIFNKSHSFGTSTYRPHSAVTVNSVLIGRKLRLFWDRSVSSIIHDEESQGRQGLNGHKTAIRYIARSRRWGNYPWRGNQGPGAGPELPSASQRTMREALLPVNNTQQVSLPQRNNTVCGRPEQAWQPWWESIFISDSNSCSSKRPPMPFQISKRPWGHKRWAFFPLCREHIFLINIQE